MSGALADIKSIFVRAIELPSAAERDCYLVEACAGDSRLRSEVDALLKAQNGAAAFFEGLGPAISATIGQPLEHAGSLIGQYKLLQEIGEGGFGVVYMAEQQEPVRRKVALKVIKPGMDTRQVIARFEAERQALAVMDHPNIAKVLDAGTVGSEPSGVSPGSFPPAHPGGSQGRLYFVMELVRGTPITQYCDDHQLPIRERLLLFASVCQAIQHAHTKGIIHRDIKPTNVLITQQDGQPLVKVIDFGIAKAMGQQLTEKTLFTEFAQMIGTPLYMSPEQAAMTSVDIDTRSDIYSLGVLLYELLTGSTPVNKEQLKEANFDEIRRIIQEDEAQRPSVRICSCDTLPAIAARRHVEPGHLRLLVRGELDWIVMKCLEKDRNRRYGTAAALAADIERFLNDEPVQACPPSRWYRFTKFARRNRREVLIAAAAAVVGVTGVAGLAVSRALIARAKEDLRLEVYFQRITVAHRELSIGNLTAALRALQECPGDLRGWEWHYLMRLFKYEPLVVWDSTEVYGVAFSPDGQRIASAGRDGMIKIWSSQTGKLLRKIRGAHDKGACSVAFHPYGEYLASAGADRLAKVWDLQTGRVVFSGPCDAVRKFGASCTVAFRPPDGRHLAAGCNGEVKVWDWQKNQPETPEHTFQGPDYDSIPVAFTRDGLRLATGSARPQGVSLRDVETGQLIHSYPTNDQPITALAFSTNGSRLAATSVDRSVKLWNTTTGELLQDIRHTGNVLGVAFSSDDRRLVWAGGEDKAVHICDVETGRDVLTLHGHKDMCGCVQFSPDGWRLASVSHDRTIRVWDATPLRQNEGQEALTFSKHGHEVRSVAVSPDGRWIASGGNGDLVKVWDAVTGRERFDFPNHSAPVFSVAWHPDPDTKRIATAGSAGRQNTVKVWDPSDGRVDFTIPVNRDSFTGPYQAVAFRPPDGRYLVTGQIEGAVQVWDARTGKAIQTLGIHGREIRAVVFSPDGRHLASASGDGDIYLWDATRLEQVQEPQLLPFQARVPGPSVNVAFSPDSRRLATGGEKNSVKIWDMEKGGEPLTLPGHNRQGGHNKEVYAVAFSPDAEGRWIASGGEDGKVKIWDSRSGEFVFTFHGHAGLVSSLAFSPDGNRLYSASRDTKVKVWDMSKLRDAPEQE